LRTRLPNYPAAELRIATAETPEECERKVGQLSDDFVNSFFAWITLPWTDGQTLASSVPQGLAIAGRTSLKRPEATAARAGIRAFRGLSSTDDENRRGKTKY
jgi:hypothetical protein